MQKIPSIILLILLITLFQCKFIVIDQPSRTATGEIVEISLTIYDDVVPEPNPHKGLLCILMPQDWSYISSDYDCGLGTGTLTPSPEWTDSVEACYPNAQLGEEMKWIALISDTGYAYDDPLTMNIDIKLRAGETQGCFQMGYLATKATQDLLCTGWSTISYPHPIGIPDSCAADRSFKTQIEGGWDDLFNRTSGWTGADGIYSIPLSGMETPSENQTEKTLLVFSDTFIGDVDENGRRQKWRLVNNTYAVMAGTQPVDENTDFYWATDNNDNPATVFVPETPNTNPGDWYWLMDGIAIDDIIHVFGLRLETGSGGLFNFKVVGVTLLSFELDSANQIVNSEQRDTPLYHEFEGGDVVFGQAVMSMTDKSGHSNADGYIYVYGPKNGSNGKGLAASRVRPENFEDFAEWEFWDGSGWAGSITECATITNGISQEFSVSPLDNGEFALVFQTGSSVAVRFSNTPVGPFDFYHIIYDCPEPEVDPNIFVYNAKAHPHLSADNNLLISYNVNTFSFADHIQFAEIYRPRFISLQLDLETQLLDEGMLSTPSSFQLDQNYPNPFNARTMIHFTISESANVALKIYNVVGREVRTMLADIIPSGSYTINWDGKGEAGLVLSSGIYMMTLQVDSEIISRKMIHLK